MDTLIYTEAGKTEGMQMAGENQLVDLNVKIARELKADRKIKISQPHSKRNTEKSVRTNHLLRLL